MKTTDQQQEMLDFIREVAIAESAQPARVKWTSRIPAFLTSNLLVCSLVTTGLTIFIVNTQEGTYKEQARAMAIEEVRQEIKRYGSLKLIKVNEPNRVSQPANSYRLVDNNSGI